MSWSLKKISQAKNEVNISEKVEHYFELKKIMEQTEKEIKDFIESNSDLDLDYTWIDEIVELPKKYDEKRQKYYLITNKYLAYEQNNYFIWQVTQFEDSYYGEIYYPLKNDKYLKISFSC